MVLLMIDAYSRKIWTRFMNVNTTATKTLAVLFSWFCEESGFPTTLVSDNGPQFTSSEFASKMSKWKIKHILTLPYHPASNGLAERGVGIFKDKLKKMGVTGSPLDLSIALAYIGRVHGLTPHTATDASPYEMMRKGTIPSLFQNLCPQQTSRSELEVTNTCARKIRKPRPFQEGDDVNVFDNHTEVSYKGKVTEVLGKNNYLVDSEHGTKHVSGDVLTKISDIVNRPTGGNTQFIEDDEDLESIQSDISDMSEDLEDVITPLEADPYGTNLRFRRSRRREIDQLGQQSGSLPRLRSGKL